MAQVEIVDIVMNRRGPVIKWGDRTVRNGQAIVLITDVTFPYVNPPYSFHTYKDDTSSISWKKEDTTMQMLYENNKNLLVNTCSLMKNVVVDSEKDANTSIFSDDKLLKTVERLEEPSDNISDSL